MITAVSDHSNRNSGTAMGMGGDERIASCFISILRLVSDPLFLCLFLVNVRGGSVYSFTGLDPSDHSVTVCSFTSLKLAERGVIVCSFTLTDLSEWGVNECYFLGLLVLVDLGVQYFSLS